VSRTPASCDARMDTPSPARLNECDAPPCRIVGADLGRPHHPVAVTRRSELRPEVLHGRWRGSEGRHCGERSDGQSREGTIAAAQNGWRFPSALVEVATRNDLSFSNEEARPAGLLRFGYMHCLWRIYSSGSSGSSLTNPTESSSYSALSTRSQATPATSA
jgi:hypothetical protein